MRPLGARAASDKQLVELKGKFEKLTVDANASQNRALRN